MHYLLIFVITIEVPMLGRGSVPVFSFAIVVISRYSASSSSFYSYYRASLLTSVKTAFSILYHHWTLQFPSLLQQRVCVLSNLHKVCILFATLEHFYSALNTGWQAIDEHFLGTLLGINVTHNEQPLCGVYPRTVLKLPSKSSSKQQSLLWVLQYYCR